MQVKFYMNKYKNINKNKFELVAFNKENLFDHITTQSRVVGWLGLLLNSGGQPTSP